MISFDPSWQAKETLEVLQARLAAGGSAPANAGPARVRPLVALLQMVLLQQLGDPIGYSQVIRSLCT